jgi:ribose transport system permease protein
VIEMESRRQIGWITRGLSGFVRNNIGIMLVLLIFVIALSLQTPHFLTVANIQSVLRQVFNNVCLALGVALVMIAGGIDLTGGAVIAMTGTITVGLIVYHGVPIPMAILTGSALGVFTGLFNGTVISTLGVPPFIVTLGVMNIARGTAYLGTGGLATRIEEVTYPGYAVMGVGRPLGIPIQIYYAIVLILIFVIILNKTRLGTYIYAIGGNREAARLSGVPIRRVEIVVYALSGLMGAIAGVVLTARMYSAQPSVAQGYELDAIAACVLGGVSMSGGVGRISGVILGVLVIGTINNGLNLLNVNYFWQLIAKGIVILIAIYIDTIKRRGRFKEGAVYAKDKRGMAGVIGQIGRLFGITPNRRHEDLRAMKRKERPK